MKEKEVEREGRNRKGVSRKRGKKGKGREDD